jgi:hypothetical protein
MGFHIVARHLLVGSRLPITRFFFWGKNVATASDAKDKKGKKNAPPS